MEIFTKAVKEVASTLETFENEKDAKGVSLADFTNMVKSWLITNAGKNSKTLADSITNNKISTVIHQFEQEAEINQETPVLSIKKGKNGGVFKGFAPGSKQKKSEDEVISSFAEKGKDKVIETAQNSMNKVIKAFKIIGMSRDEVTDALTAAMAMALKDNFGDNVDNSLNKLDEQANDAAQEDNQ